MSNPFVDSVKRLIDLHGTSVTYVKVTKGVYNVETGSTSNSETTASIVAYPKRPKVSSYNYPNLVGKEVIEFLVKEADLASAPQKIDKIQYKGNTYQVDSFTEYMARGEVVLYKIVTYKG